MSIPQVGSGAFAVVPTFKGFRKAVTSETDAAGNAAASGFRRIWSKEGSDSGKSTGAGFKKAFEGQATGFSTKATRELEQAVAKSASALSAARLKEQDAAGKARVAERQLAEAREKYASDSSQVVRAEERLATANRQLETAQDKTRSSTKELASAQDSLARAADNAGEQLGESGRKGASRFSSGFSDVFKGSFLGTTVAGLASSLVSNIGQAIGTGLRTAIEFGLGTIDIASDLNESVNAVQVSYGAIADEIFALGDTSAKTFGLSKRDLNAYAVQFSAFAKGIAGEGGDVSGTFQSILGRATDFASVMNLEVAEALGLFQSGLAGETEPLRRYGIDLSAATVQAYALANGIGDGSAELTEAQKQQARYGALLAQTAAVQGDFANTSDELANKNRINAATWDDLQAKIGGAFLPIASAVGTVLANDVFPVISEMVDKYGPELAAAFQEAIPALQDLAAEVLPKLPELFNLIAESLPAVIDGGSQVFAIMVEGGKVLLPILSFLTTETTSWFSAMNGLFSFLGGDTTLRELDGTLLDTGGSFRFLLDAARGALNGIMSTVEGIGDLGRRLYSSGRSLIQGFIDGINDMLRPVGNAVSGVMNFVAGFFPNSPAKRGPFSGAGWTRVGDGGGALIEQFQSGMRAASLAVPVDSAAAVIAAKRTVSGQSLGAGATVTQYITTQQTDPRVQARQWAREAQREFAAS